VVVLAVESPRSLLLLLLLPQTIMTFGKLDSKY
jgi:hypothetical protein